jgi:Zn-dependent peptidase ImmA (M78 family)
MGRNWTNTETVKFFLQKYQRSTVSEAAEVAAQKAREMLKDLCGAYRIPVNIEAVAQQHGIQMGGFLDASDLRIGALFSENNKYIAKIAPDGATRRDRFTLAHEIGHSLFREGRKHYVESIAKGEREAEDRISEMFATALLMPARNIPQIIEQIPSEGPWQILIALEKAAKRFLVSLPAMISRVGQVRCRKAHPITFLCLQYFVNRYTGRTPRLRVLICSRLSQETNMRTWYNRSAEGLGLAASQMLFTQWSQLIGESGEITGGRYILDREGNLVRAGQSTLDWTWEQLNLSIYNHGSWRKQSLRVQVANCLYARQGWHKHQVYIVSIIKGS